MSVKSNILKQRLKSDSGQFVSTTPLPPEEWPTLTDSQMYALIVDEIEPLPDLSVIGVSASWTHPTTQVTFVLMMAAAQDNPTPLPEDYETILQVNGNLDGFGETQVTNTYVSFFGEFTLSDLGRYVPYIIKFTDQYGREDVVENSVTQIIAP